MKQSRSSSGVEAVFHIIAGFILNTILNLIVLPWFGFSPSLGQSLGITAIYTAVAIPRSYAVRRIFEHLRVAGWFP